MSGMCGLQAACEGNTAAVELLLAAGSAAALAPDILRRTPMHCAALRDHKSSYDVLLAAGNLEHVLCEHL